MMIVCPDCGTINRIPDGKLYKQGQCGKCKTSLDSPPVGLNDQNFSRYINKNDLPVLVDFWASWCGPCQMMKPVFEQAAKQQDRLLFAKVNTEAAQQVGARYAIRSIPTLILFHKGKEIERIAGALQKPQLEQWINQALNKIG